MSDALHPTGRPPAVGRQNRCIVCRQPVAIREPARSYRTLREQMVSEGHTWECARSMHLNTLALMPRRWKRGQKRTARDSRRARRGSR